MGNKPTWIQVLKETISAPTIIAFILGVPAMITLILTIWHSLSGYQQIIVISSGIFIVFSIGLFIYGQTRKILYVIPNILHKMHIRATELASKIDLSKLDLEGIKSFLSLGGVDFDSLLTEEVTTDNLIEIVGKAIEMAEIQSKQKTQTDKKSATRASRYLGEKTGLRQLLAGDKTYTKLTAKLRTMRTIIPTTEISIAVNKYIRTSEAISDFLPMLKYIDKETTLSVLPLEQATDSLSTPEQIEDEMATLLSGVRESIHRYYRGG